MADLNPPRTAQEGPAGGPGREADRERRPGVGSRPASDQAVAEPAVEETFLSVVDEGRRRMSRRLPSILFTGAVGGIDVGTGVLALLLVEQ
ncbi:MAG TPA: hypothetical protein VHT49_08070, partial [Acidimicrobiales bacterium]|nr:hypothetical protein [Acidimicrobiales bacterium]